GGSVGASGLCLLDLHLCSPQLLCLGAVAAGPGSDGMPDAARTLRAFGYRQVIDAGRIEQLLPAIVPEAVLQQARCPDRPILAGGFAENDRHELTAIARGAGNDVEAGIADEAGFQSV